jgi:hypothetical protein
MVALAACAALALALAGCGIKAPPLPRDQVAPAAVKDLAADPEPQGVMVSFGVPRVEKPGRRVVEARLYYGYLPLVGQEDCPPCPPRLRRHRVFQLEGQEAGLMEGGRFRYLDRQAPLGKEALYRVVLVDARGRESRRSNLARAPRVEPPPAPQGLAAEAGDSVVALSWQGRPVEPLPADASLAQRRDHLAGWVVRRQGPEGELKLNEEPLNTPELLDKSVTNGADYSYSVAAVRRVKGRLIEGRQSGWVSARPSDQTPPGPPTGLQAVSTAEGVYLRFTPSPAQDVRGYLVYRTDGRGGFELVSQELVQENTFVDGEVETRQVYRYKVMAVDEAGNESEFSEELEIEHIP